MRKLLEKMEQINALPYRKRPKPTRLWSTNQLKSILLMESVTIYPIANLPEIVN